MQMKKMLMISAALTVLPARASGLSDYSTQLLVGTAGVVSFGAGWVVSCFSKYRETVGKEAAERNRIKDVEKMRSALTDISRVRSECNEMRNATPAQMVDKMGKPALEYAKDLRHKVNNIVLAYNTLAKLEPQAPQLVQLKNEVDNLNGLGQYVAERVENNSRVLDALALRRKAERGLKQSYDPNRNSALRFADDMYTIEASLLGAKDLLKCRNSGDLAECREIERLLQVAKEKRAQIPQDMVQQELALRKAQVERDTAEKQMHAAHFHAAASQAQVAQANVLKDRAIAQVPQLQEEKRHLERELAEERNEKQQLFDTLKATAELKDTFKKQRDVVCNRYAEVLTILMGSFSPQSDQYKNYEQELKNLPSKGCNAHAAG